MLPPWLTVRLAGYALGALLVAAGLWLAYDYAFDRGVAAERARWDASTAEAGARFAEALAEQQARIERLDRDLADARRTANRKREELSDAIATDPAARDWSRGRIPDSVRAALDRRRDLPADPGRADGAVQPAGAGARD
jgi:hypothetical protein